jgi:sec-independent protein translocase protein TatC
MAGAMDEDTARAVASGRETAGAMLSTAQSNLKRVFLFFLLGMLGAFFTLRWYVWDLLKEDVLYAQMDGATREATTVVATTPFEVILLQVKVGLIVGVVVAVPSVVWYSREALKRRGYWPSDRIPRWQVAAILAFVGVLFVAGVFYAYRLFFPLMFAFLAENAVNAGFEPTYSIAKWTEFILLLTLSFGLAAQLPLGMSGMALSGVVPYETFREKWRYAVVGIFVFGAMFSPPDPFTQIMWAVPLIALYGFSLGLTRLLVLSKRAGEHVPVRTVLRDHWNVLAGAFVLAGGGTYAYLTRGGLEATNAGLDAVGSSYRFPTAADLGALGLGPTAVAGGVAAGAGLVVAGLAVFYLRIRALEAVAAGGPVTVPDAETTAAKTAPSAGEPARIDIGELSAAAVEAAPPEAFADLTEAEAVEHAEQALADDDAEKA